MKKYFTTTNTKECYKSLEFVYTQLLLCNTDSYHWKWVLIGMHNALQNFMVCSLRDDAGGSILKAKQRNKYYINLREQLPYQNSELDYFLELYKGIKNKNEYKNYPVKIFLPEKDDDEKIKKLNDYRNIFLHYKGESLMINVSEFLECIGTSIKIINFLINDEINFVFPNKKEKIYTKDLILKVNKLVEEYNKKLK